MKGTPGVRDEGFGGTDESVGDWEFSSNWVGE